MIEGGWRLKDLHKLIMTSAVYMQSTEKDEVRSASDPDNLLIWHQRRSRLEAEIIRDAMLAASGQLDRTQFGPGTLDESHRRRSIYFTIKRSQLVPSMMLYDAPDSLTSLGQRATTIVGPQALAMLNNEQVVAYAAAFARRLLGGDVVKPEENIRRAYQIALARPPDAEELSDALDFLSRSRSLYESSGHEKPAEQALADFCQVLFCLNEFLYAE